jgi:hypothetical protein
MLDRYLAREGYAAQEREEPPDPARAVDLWSPVSGAHRVRGRFDAESKSTCASLWLDTHRRAALGATLCLTLVALMARRRRASLDRS